MVKEREVLSREGRREERYSEMTRCFPPRLRSELREIGRSTYGYIKRISEVRIRRRASSSIIISGVEYPLFYRASDAEMDEVIERITGGAMYAHRETVASGYISYLGMRVGVSGVARYDGESIGVGEINSLVFRVGFARCDFAPRLYEFWRSSGRAGLLIIAPPSGGKTTALRALAGLIGGGKDRMRVVLVDERGEFYPEDYADHSVDVLSRYKRSLGIELAYRTMNAEVIMVDEIARREDADALISAHGVGCALIATAHASSAPDIAKRPILSSLIESGVFSVGAVITSENGAYGFSPFFIDR
jgi:stage III sporulation protein AA